MGFPATTGASFLPYLITDKVVAPERCQPCYSECLAYMPHCYFVNDYKNAHMVTLLLTVRDRLFSPSLKKWGWHCLYRQQTTGMFISARAVGRGKQQPFCSTASYELQCLLEVQGVSEEAEMHELQVPATSPLLLQETASFAKSTQS